MTSLLIITASLALSIAAVLTYYLAKFHHFLRIVDHPNARSLHTHPTPVTGGLALFGSGLITLSLTHILIPCPEILLWTYITASLIAAISFLDDWRTLSAGYRLLAHFIASFILLNNTDLTVNFSLLPIELNHSQPLSFSLTLLFIVWMINLYNFMDGMDGFAAGMALFGFGSLAILGSVTGELTYTLINLIIASATTGFLLFNFPPAKIFMGDTGASTLGFLAATLSLWGNQLGIFPLEIALLIFSPFILDATLTLFYRLFRREKIWLAHKSHYYQRLVQSGWGHKKTVLWEYTLMALCSLSAVVITSLFPSQLPLLFGTWALIYTGLIYGLTRKLQNSIVP